MSFIRCPKSPVTRKRTRRQQGGTEIINTDCDEST